jgi:hypothetical protein
MVGVSRTDPDPSEGRQEAGTASRKTESSEVRQEASTGWSPVLSSAIRRLTSSFETAGEQAATRDLHTQAMRTRWTPFTRLMGSWSGRDHSSSRREVEVIRGDAALQGAGSWESAKSR